MHLYFHIPFCKQACHYCDFHFSVNLREKDNLVKALLQEIELQKNYLISKNINSIYFGGGTPSLLQPADFELILNKINTHFQVSSDAEITLEANPDDINISRLKDWKTWGFNRLSIGIQTFNESHLKFLNRAHTSNESQTAISKALQAGFEDLSIDLIYAIPSDNNEIWKLDLATALKFPINHLSAYSLTIEEKTVFGKRLQKKIMEPISDQFSAAQYEILIEYSAKAGFEQYEISNFARNGKYAKHNTSYWKNEPYLGIGPSAHSFNGENRQWNISSNGAYIKNLGLGKIPFTKEILTLKEKANELLMTGLRTKWGANMNELATLVEIKDEEFERTLLHYFQKDFLLLQDNTIHLTEKGKLIADRISSDLFFT